MNRYADTTENTLGATGAHHLDVIPAARPSHIRDPRCVGSDLEWVPDQEATLVPEEMAAVCRDCPGRTDCLLLALFDDVDGYWAGTTTRQRRQLGQEGSPGEILAVVDNDSEQARVRALPVHPAGEGSQNHYRYSRCRCDECRAAHTLARQEERARLRARQRRPYPVAVLAGRSVEGGCVGEGRDAAAAA